jgi:hypothetical protein
MGRCNSEKYLQAFAKMYSTSEFLMLIHFTIEAGCIPITDQARESLFAEYLHDLETYDPIAQTRARNSIQSYLKTHTEFTAAWIASTGRTDEWHPEFEALYEAMLRVCANPAAAHEAAGKFLGLLVWNEALIHSERWHFTKYPKLETDYEVAHYFSMDAHVCSKVKRRQSAVARAHGDTERAEDLEASARALEARWRR